MKRISARTGSALLVVLGMLAFITASGLAFAAFMRQSRLPSSFLRRQVAARELVKAALVEAIDRIDTDIGNAVSPNRGGGNWTHHVYMGSPQTDSEGLEEEAATIGTTVPTLTLEGLAYVPPILLNEARYYSRLSYAGKWHSLGFNSGRYAFSAIDVSDCFDVNRALANVPRSSSSKRRVTLGYLFEDEDHKSLGNGPQAWDDFMTKFRKYDADTGDFSFDGKMPLVSVADLNLAMGTKTVGGLKSPFCQYLKGDWNSLVPNEYETVDIVSRMPFVTDSIYVRAAEQTLSSGTFQGKPVIDLASNQPFTREYLEKTSKPTVFDVTAQGGTCFTRLVDVLPNPGLAALYDYLDPDRVPESLAIPTTERVAMVCGIRPAFSGVVTLNLVKGEASEPSSNGEVTRTDEYVLDLSGLSGDDVDVLVTYPFTHEDGLTQEDRRFTIGGRLAFFLSSAEDDKNLLGLRTNNSSQNELLHLTTDNASAADLIQKAVLSVPLEEQDIAFDAKIASVENALECVTFRTADGVRTVVEKLGGAETKPFTITYRWTYKRGANGKWIKTDPTAADVESATCAWRPLGNTGVTDGDFEDKKLAEWLGDGKSRALRFDAAVSVYVKHKDAAIGESYVDLVPACIPDDTEFLKVNNQGDLLDPEILGGKPYPVMRFATGMSFTLQAAPSVDVAQEFALEQIPNTVLVADPRYNHAPENWFAISLDSDDPEAFKNLWLDNNGTDGQNGRSADIFMATSDQGYLQSVYEFAFLPRLSDLKSFGANDQIGDLPDHSTLSVATLEGRSRADAVDANFMWRCYEPFGDDFDAFQELGLVSTGSGGLRVNPYSESTNVILAAFANTPHDWRMCSTNNQELTLEEMDAAEFNSSYAWNAYSAGSRLAWSDVSAFASAYMAQLGTGGTDWKAALNNLDWGGGAEDDTFLGVTLSDDTDLITSADRRFFYGYWRECFEANQQLFLIFVRAEPVMMGGDSQSITPPQLGGRAVALVWRDPTSRTAKDGSVAPHQTRVLLYRVCD